MNLPIAVARPVFSRYRWVICALLFFATTINYVDRQVIGILKTTLIDDLGWTEDDFGEIVMAFNLAYAASYLGAGWLMDRIGVRLGFSISVTLWSLAAMAGGFMRTVFGFKIARGALGLAEGGNFPGSIKTVGEWFPKKERALATGIFNAGSNVGALITPLLVPWITIQFGWPVAFYATGAVGLLWLVFWLAMYRHPDQHRRVSTAELDYIRSDPVEKNAGPAIPWIRLLGYRATWAFTFGQGLTSPIWWFYLYWVPGFFQKEHGLNLTEVGWPLVIIYLLADVGSVAGGGLSSWLLHRGWSVNAARKTALAACALCVVPVFLVADVSNVWIAACLIGLAAAAHQGWSANVYTIVSDTMPRGSVSSVVGIGGMVAALLGAFAAKIIGLVLYWTGDYRVLFGTAAVMYLVCLLIIQIVLPKIKPVHA